MERKLDNLPTGSAFDFVVEKDQNHLTQSLPFMIAFSDLLGSRVAIDYVVLATPGLDAISSGYGEVHKLAESI